MLAPNSPRIDPEAQRAIQPFLQPDETLLWAEMPPGWRLGIRELPTLLFLLIWNAGVWTIISIMVPFNWLLGLFGYQAQANVSMPFPFLPVAIMFLVIGVLGLVASARNFLNGWLTYYALTGQRVIVVQKVPPGRVTSFWEQALSTMSRTGSRGRGTISFGDRYPGTIGMWLGTPSKLIGISNPASVEALIISALQPSRTEGRKS